MDGFLLNKGTCIEIEGKTYKGIVSAANILKRDIQQVFVTSSINVKTTIKVYIDKQLKNAPETFRIEALSPETLVISSLDELGAIYGLLHISSKYLKVDPFWFFCDKEPELLEQVVIDEKVYCSNPFYVKYRGWFVNDEVLLLGLNQKAPELKVWERVFETLLRLGGNMVIPGTGSHTHQLRDIAVRMGLWITHHHAEPLGAKMFLNVYPDKVPIYDINADLFEKLWRDAVSVQKENKIIWNIGFRGQGDRAFWEDDSQYDTMEKRGAFISRIMQRQYDIISEQVENPIVCTNLYGEILELYKQGFLKFPEGTIKIWADSGYGKMVSRRQINHNPRIYAVPQSQDIGPHGIYYHVTFYDLQASNHLTMLPNTPEFVQQELTHAFKEGANEYLIVNSGNVRPHTYLLDAVHKLWQDGDLEVAMHQKAYIERFFKVQRKEISDCIGDYFKNTIHYGVHEDEKAGEQFYHYISRYIISFWIKGEKQRMDENLLWATGDIDFPKQVTWFKEKCEGALESWTQLRQKCLEVAARLEGKEKQFFMDWLYTQVVLHESGCRGAIALGKSYKHFKKQDYIKAFVYASQAKLSFEEGPKVLKEASHDKWEYYYTNDCLTNVELTVSCLEMLRGYIRIMGDAPTFYDWEKEYLYPEDEKGVALLTNTSKQLTDEVLAQNLAQKLNIG